MEQQNWACSLTLCGLGFETCSCGVLQRFCHILTAFYLFFYSDETDCWEVVWHNMHVSLLKLPYAKDPSCQHSESMTRETSRRSLPKLQSHSQHCRLKRVPEWWVCHNMPSHLNLLTNAGSKQFALFYMFEIHLLHWCQSGQLLTDNDVIFFSKALSLFTQCN